MPNIISVTVAGKVARNDRPKEAVYICGNSDYVVRFAFDAEWDAYEAKTARFKYNGTYQDVVFTGNECAVPIIENTYKIQVGVFAGNLSTTTPADFMAMKSILCGEGAPAAPTPDVYSQIMEMLKNAGGGGGSVDPEEVKKIVNDALAQAKESGEFDGKDGKDGYTPVKGVDYFDGKDGSDGADGKDGQDGYTPVKGADYFTEADKAEMVNAVLVALPTAEGGSF